MGPFSGPGAGSPCRAPLQRGSWSSESFCIACVACAPPRCSPFLPLVGVGRGREPRCRGRQLRLRVPAGGCARLSAPPPGLAFRPVVLGGVGGVCRFSSPWSAPLPSPSLVVCGFPPPLFWWCVCCVCRFVPHRSPALRVRRFWEALPPPCAYASGAAGGGPVLGRVGRTPTPLPRATKICS